MPNVTFVGDDGERRTVSVPPGVSLMQAAVDNGVDGIVGECGGSRTCGTCHVYIDEAFVHAVGPPGRAEHELLDATAAPRAPNSRLGCQIPVTERLDGLVARLPESQY